MFLCQHLIDSLELGQYAIKKVSGHVHTVRATAAVQCAAYIPVSLQPLWCMYSIHTVSLQCTWCIAEAMRY